MDEAIVYQIGEGAWTCKRFIVVTYGHNDAAVERALLPGEAIETTATLRDVLGSQVSFILPGELK